MTHVTVSEAKGGSVINDSVEKEIGSLVWPAYSPRGLGFRTPKERSSSGSPKKRAHIPPGSDALSLLRGKRWVGGLVGLWGSSLSQLSPQCSCIHHKSGGTIFTKPPSRCQGSSLCWKPQLKAHWKLKGKSDWLTVFYLWHYYTTYTPLWEPNPTAWHLPSVC